MQQCDMLLHAAIIVTQDSERRVLENASLAVDHGQVAAVGPRADLAHLADRTRRL